MLENLYKYRAFLNSRCRSLNFVCCSKNHFPLIPPTSLGQKVIARASRGHRATRDAAKTAIATGDRRETARDSSRAGTFQTFLSVFLNWCQIECANKVFFRGGGRTFIYLFIYYANINYLSPPPSSRGQRLNLNVRRFT